MPAPEADLLLLAEAARAAGEIALGFWRQAPKTWDKADGAGPVTEADLAVDRMLAARLRSARPDYGWLSEETPDSGDRLAARRVFIIDPIDGTRAFIDGGRDFAHSLAVAEAGRIIAAVIFLPAQNRLYSAAKGGDATMNGTPISVSGRPDIGGATVLARKSTFSPEHWNEGAPPAVRQVFRSSLAWRLALVAEGAFDATMTLRPAWEWDIAAGALIAECAGARVTDQRGEALFFNRPDPRAPGLVAATPAVHASILDAFAP